jgi:hypothetical protein
VVELSAKKIARYVSLGLLDQAADGPFVVHDWIRFQPKDPTAAERKARSRARRRESAETRESEVAP